jgi:hypothetical protein
MCQIEPNNTLWTVQGFWDIGALGYQELIHYRSLALRSHIHCIPYFALSEETHVLLAEKPLQRHEVRALIILIISGYFPLMTNLEG